MAVIGAQPWRFVSGSVDLLVDVVPVRATEEPAKSSRERRSFVVSDVDFDDRRTDGGTQRCGYDVSPISNQTALPS
jgi:hypothetical protein